MITMSVEDAKIVLKDLVIGQYNDSLLKHYIERDSLNNIVILTQKEVLTTLGEGKLNLEQIIKNLEQVIRNKDTEIKLKDQVIQEQKKEIKRQKTFKILSMIGMVVLPITILLLN